MPGPPAMPSAEEPKNQSIKGVLHYFQVYATLFLNKHPVHVPIIVFRVHCRDMRIQLGHSDPALTLRVYTHALPTDPGDLGFVDFGTSSGLSFHGPGRPQAAPRPDRDTVVLGDDAGNLASRRTPGDFVLIFWWVQGSGISGPSCSSQSLRPGPPWAAPWFRSPR